MRPLFVKAAPKFVEARLLFSQRESGRGRRFQFKSSMHSFVPAILTGLSGMNALMQNPKLSPLDRQLAQSQRTRRSERASVIRTDSLWQTVFAHRGFTDGVNVFEVHFGYGLASDDVSAVRVRHGKRITALFVAAPEKSP